MTKIIKTKNDAKIYIDTLENEINFMDWETGEMIRLRENNGTYLLEDTNISERFQSKEKAIDFVYKHRKQFNKFM